MQEAQREAGALAGVDVGGTFTDVVITTGRAPRAVKVPTTPSDQSRGLADGITNAAGGVEMVAAVAHGTTTATNAVLERSLARTVLVTTEGFRDLLVIGRQDRPSLYDLSVVRPEPVVPSELVVTVAERTAADGSVVVDLTDDEVRRVVDAVADLAPESIAVCLLFSYVAPAHEERLCTALRARLDIPVTRSSELLPEFREYERASTCVLDAAVAPAMRRYLERLNQRVGGAAVTVMTSGGGVADAGAVAAAPVHTLLSGPAAGVVAAAAIAEQAGFADALAFDMGGTSTDVCLILGGRPEVSADGLIGGLPFATPAVAVHTVGAGGGSIAWIDQGGALRVGPQSAGARPGPACYGHGGTQPTVTDAHAVLGHLLDDQALGDSGLRLDRAAAATAMSTLSSLSSLSKPGGFDSAAEAAAGVIAVVGATMLRALRRVSTERGADPGGLALVAYGGAGPLHATALARELGCAAAVIPPAPGVLSALGLLLAPPRREVSRTVMARWERSAAPPELGAVWRELEAQARDGVADSQVRLVADCRYAGQSHELRIAYAADRSLDEDFDRAHAEAYGYAMPAEPIDIVTARAIAEGVPAMSSPPAAWDHGEPGGAPSATITGPRGDAEVAVVHRATLTEGTTLSGPALVVQPDSTTLLREGDRAEVVAGGALVVRW